jgi:mono/diheme cytochrome c family protein
VRKLNPSIALAAVIAASAMLVAACGSEAPSPPPGLDEVQLAGWQAYVDLNCGACHGAEREGQRSGPALIGLSKHWTAEELVHYLNDPDEVVMANPRLKFKAEKFAIGMPSASGKSPGFADKARADKLRALAQYLMVDVQPTQE